MSNTVEEKETGDTSPLLLKVLTLNAKIKRGDYAFEKALCFCGDNQGVEVINKDRYGIFYTMNLCPKCGVMYASPRMTKESSEEFYQTEYRDIYEYGSDKEDEWQLGIERANAFKNIIDDFEIKPKVVFDIGCNMGQHLSLFKDEADTYGVDYSSENVTYGKEKGLNLFHGGIEILEGLDKKADLIILSHVLEHFNDIGEELDRISKLLSDEGVLYIEVPGLYSCDLNTLFQNAHNWQFNRTTLTYVMRACGWDEIYTDERIKSLWKYTGNFIKDEYSVQRQGKEIYDFVFSGNNVMPTLTANCKFPLKERKENIEKAVSFEFKDISVIHNKHQGKETIIIGGAPSVNNYIDKIKGMKEQGNIIISIERMYQWCLNNDIVPDYVLVLDASDDVIESFGRIHPDVTHIIATQCKEDIFKKLKDYKTVIFSSAQSGIDFANVYSKNNYKKITIINTGSSVVLASMSIAMFLGLRNLHIFGFDCHISKGDYAKGITGVGVIENTIQVEVDNKEYLTTVAYASFAQQFFEIWKLGKANNLIDNVKVYGDSLIKAMSKIDIDGDK